MSGRSRDAIKPHLVVLLAVMCLCMVLAGCGSSHQGEEASVHEPEPVEGAFEGREKRDPSELEEYVEKALALGDERRAVSEEEKEEGTLTIAQKDAFKMANAAYRDGAYEDAQKGYEEVLEAYPEHYGANVNLALALLQQEKNDDALVQALTCLALYPEDDGVQLNVQTAAVACGFSTESALEDAALVVVRKVRDESSKLSDKLKAELEYNKLWDDIETELYDAAQGTASNGEYVYKSLRTAVDELADGDLADDKDAQALRAYLVAVGTQIGYEEPVEADADAEKAADEKAADEKAADEEAAAEKDAAEQKDAADDKDKSSDAKDADEKKESSDEDKPAKEADKSDVDLSAVEAHLGLPYVVADDEVCTIVFTGYHMSADNPIAEFEFVNHTKGSYHFFAEHDVTANGEKIDNFSAGWPTINGVGQDSAWGNFFSTEDDKVVSVVEGNLEQLSCVMSVGKWGSDPVASYPLKWQADPEQQFKELDGKMIDDEGGVTITLQKVLPASDGIVAVEYKGSYKGEGPVTIEGDGWSANGKDVELLSAGTPLSTGTVGHRYLLFRAKNAGDLREGRVERLAGTLIIRDAEGKELVNEMFELKFDE
ncbi:MAG: hypothetical protein IKG18_16420 [Atopobiaceae bacterium]|nr:hypothetical protein [Atopobiaceae bacterium]